MYRFNNICWYYGLLISNTREQGFLFLLWRVRWTSGIHDLKGVRELQLYLQNRWLIFSNYLDCGRKMRILFCFFLNSWIIMVTYFSLKTFWQLHTFSYSVKYKNLPFTLHLMKKVVMSSHLVMFRSQNWLPLKLVIIIQK